MKRDEKKFVDTLMYLFKAPYITWPHHEDYVTPEMMQIAEIERFKNITEIMEKKEATNYEVVIYLHTASLINPLPHNFAKIYFHCFAKYYDIKKIFEEESSLKYYKTLDENEMHDLHRFREWIFKRQTLRLK